MEQVTLDQRVRGSIPASSASVSTPTPSQCSPTSSARLNAHRLFEQARAAAERNDLLTVDCCQRLGALARVKGPVDQVDAQCVAAQGWDQRSRSRCSSPAQNGRGYVPHRRLSAAGHQRTLRVSAKSLYDPAVHDVSRSNGLLGVCMGVRFADFASG